MSSTIQTSANVQGLSKVFESVFKLITPNLTEADRRVAARTYLSDGADFLKAMKSLTRPLQSWAYTEVWVQTVRPSDAMSLDDHWLKTLSLGLRTMVAADSELAESVLMALDSVAPGSENLEYEQLRRSVIEVFRERAQIGEAT